MRRRPGIAKGVVFVVYADIAARDRRALVGARLLVGDGPVERETERAEVPITHLIVRRLVDRSDLLDGLSAIDGDAEWAERVLGRAEEVRRPEPGLQRPARLPRSRDFR